MLEYERCINGECSILKKDDTEVEQFLEEVFNDTLKLLIIIMPKEWKEGFPLDAQTIKKLASSSNRKVLNVLKKNGMDKEVAKILVPLIYVYNEFGFPDPPAETQEGHTQKEYVKFIAMTKKPMKTKIVKKYVFTDKTTDYDKFRMFASILYSISKKLIKDGKGETAHKLRSLQNKIKNPYIDIKKLDKYITSILG